MEAQKMYDCMAEIIRYLLDTGFDADEAYAVDSDAKKSILEEAGKLLEEDGFSLTDISVPQDTDTNTPFFLIFLLQKFDEMAAKRREQEMWGKPDFEIVRCMDSLNSNSNIEKSNILIIPRYTCIWEGKSRDRHHVIDINTFLQYSFYVEVANGKIEERYTIRNHILNPQYFGPCMDNNNELHISLSISPLTDEVRIEADKYLDERGPGINYFTVKEWNEDIQAKLTEYIETVMRKADKNGDTILVFPEMLGTEAIKYNITESIRTANFENLYFVVFPSIWKCEGKHKNHNTAYVIDYEGDEWFGQEKLRKFPWENEDGTYLEDIIEGDEIHLMHCEGYGSIAVAICRSELDRGVRNLLMQKLNVKLILCPSWTKGSHEFESSIMTGIEQACNVVWCNTCSALEIDKEKERTVGIITSFGKNRDFSSMSLEGCEVPDSICMAECKEGCLFSGRIYGTDYRESQMQEVESDGCENEYTNVE